jgi:hypothetical protein
MINLHFIYFYLLILWLLIDICIFIYSTKFLCYANLFFVYYWVFIFYLIHQVLRLDGWYLLLMKWRYILILCNMWYSKCCIFHIIDFNLILIFSLSFWRYFSSGLLFHFFIVLWFYFVLKTYSFNFKYSLIYLYTSFSSSGSL